MKGSDRRAQELQESNGKEDKVNKDIRILLVEHNELIRYGLRHMLEAEGDIEVVGDCANAEEAFSQVRMLSPDIVLMDGHMPGRNGIEATRHLKRNGMNCDANVIILAESEDYQAQALEAGAACYLLKDITRAELARVIREVYWSKQSPEFVEEAVELVVPPPAEAARLLRFMCEVEEILDDNYASIMHTVGSWNWGTVITITLPPARFSAILDRISNMPEVEKAEKEAVAKGAVATFPKKLGVLPRPSISPSKRILVTLKETGFAAKLGVSS